MSPSIAGRSPIWPALLVLAVLVVLPLGRGAELPIALGALAGLVLLVRGRLDLASTGSRLAIALFACYWLAALLSAPLAVEKARTWSTVAVTLRFLPFALFAVWAAARWRWDAFVAAVAAIVAIWLLDAYVQMATGHSLGGPADAERLSGVFGAGNLKLGQTLAALSPFVLLSARARFGRRGLVIAFVLMIAPILLSGSRAAWVSYALVAVLLAWRETRHPLRLAAILVAACAGIALVGAIALRGSSGFGERIERTLLALRGTEAAVDDASAGRLSIWRTAVRMTADHPVTGVGVRGFRYAYPHYASPSDRFVDATSDTGASHAHQIVLEVLSETGLAGLALWIAGVVFAVRAWRRADPATRERALAPAIALVAMCFPLNTHLAFYSAWWGLLFWWLLALYCAAFEPPRGAVARAQ